MITRYIVQFLNSGVLNLVGASVYCFYAASKYSFRRITRKKNYADSLNIEVVR